MDELNSFIKVVEVWTPSSDGQFLVLTDGLFGKYDQLHDESRTLQFAYGEGLPGKAWQYETPEILTDLENSYFIRKRTAAEVGLTAGVAIPVFSGEFLHAVIVFLCGDQDSQAGAIEVWKKDSENPAEIKFADGYYGSLGKLKCISKNMRFRKGDGLPGSVWDYQIPILVDDMLNSPFFQRGGYALVDGITTAFALPLSYYTGQDYVLAFLSAPSTPMARRYEVWLPDREHKKLFLHAAHCQLDTEHLEKHKHDVNERGQGIIGTSWLTGCPAISKDLVKDGLVTKESAYSLDKGFTLPVIEDGVLKSVVVMMF